MSLSNTNQLLWPRSVSIVRHSWKLRVMSKSQHFLGCKDKKNHQTTTMSESHSGLILHRVKFSRRDVEAFHNITGVSLYLRRKNCHFHFYFPKTSQFKRFSVGIPRLELFHVVALISSYCFFPVHIAQPGPIMMWVTSIIYWAQLIHVVILFTILLGTWQMYCDA